MHIGFGQNTVSSLYGHQKGDHMKTIELSHKKLKANESQEKMTVTSGKDACRMIGHSDEALSLIHIYWWQYCKQCLQYAGV